MGDVMQFHTMIEFSHLDGRVDADEFDHDDLCYITKMRTQGLKVRGAGWSVECIETYDIDALAEFEMAVYGDKLPR